MATSPLPLADPVRSWVGSQVRRLLRCQRLRQSIYAPPHPRHRFCHRFRRVRDGINVARYALKRLAQGGGDPVERLLEAVRFVLGEEAAVHAPARRDDGPAHPPGPHRV